MLRRAAPVVHRRVIREGGARRHTRVRGSTATAQCANVPAVVPYSRATARQDCRRKIARQFRRDSAGAMAALKAPGVVLVEASAVGKAMRLPLRR